MARTLIVLCCCLAVLITFRYDTIREHIKDRYTETERLLVEGFMEAQKYLDVRRMKEYAQALQTFQKVGSDWSVAVHLMQHFFTSFSQGLNDVIEFYIDKNLPVSFAPWR